MDAGDVLRTQPRVRACLCVRLWGCTRQPEGVAVSGLLWAFPVLTSCSPLLDSAAPSHLHACAESFLMGKR